MEAEIGCVTKDECKLAYGSYIKDEMVCGGSDGKDSCQGDSGGPAVIESDSAGNIVGVTSFGYGCARPGYPGVYTRVQKYLEWIKDNSGKTITP